ncbi:LANO_0E15698g1_1 [Lachancea nothofagi CBS 11611]|uniref:Dihydrolipoamide dehydrogenase-binding protein of pyruvate dehydrogenase complex n=1 Tax=Lachancea nothofagi CBS 11611 TaxID=1266666 RepID=A0A1G4K198_9SACH|nr:LANO_0E15698g1_1 [Lachancea nothofagi CBS 11611]
MIFRGTLKGHVGRLAYVRSLHVGNTLYKAQVFAMPAMSPTMEKGGVVEWKFKVGDSFSAGDVLLEVETDKSQIDVEAQDDGKLAKIVVDNGAKDVNVGEVIAYLADPEDDLATLEFPKQDAPKQAAKEAPKQDAPKQEKPKSAPKEGSNKQTTNPSKDVKASGKADPSQVLLPSVQILLHENGISNEDALSKIAASGPKGRILKGDVLSFLGKVPQDSVSKVTDFIQKFEKLDLSNIELRKPEPKQKPQDAGLSKPQPVVLSEQLHLKTAPNVTIEQFTNSLKSYVNEAKYLSHEQPVENSFSDHYDALFEEIITPEPLEPRFQVSYDVVPLSGGQLNGQQHDDIFDLLAGSSNTSVKLQSTTPPSNEFLVNLNVSVSDKFDDSKIKAQRFVEYIKDLEISPEN